MTVAAFVGAVLSIAFVGGFTTYGIRTFKRAAAIAPDLYDWEASGIVKWSRTVGRVDH